MSTGALSKITAKRKGKTLRWRRSAREEGSDGKPSDASALEDPKIRAVRQRMNGENVSHMRSRELRMGNSEARGNHGSGRMRLGNGTHSP
jgi:hypothetical protein